MLLEKSETDSRLARDETFRWLLRTSDQPEQRSLPTPIPAQDRPTFSLSDREGYLLEYPRRAKFHADIRD
jgi:hypothetical protein